MTVVSYVESVLILFLAICAVFCTVLALSKAVVLDNVKLTSLQRVLLGVKSDAVGFETVFSALPFGQRITTRPSVHTSPLQYMTPTRSPPSSVYSTPQAKSSGTQSASPSPFRAHHTVSKLSPNKIGYFLDLDRYLQSEEESELMVLTRHPQERTSPVSQWYHSNSPSTRRYHIATPESHKPVSSSDCEPEVPCNELGITREKLEYWTERCRKWLAGTVLQPVAKEIQAINASLRKNGSPELQLGSTDLGTLRRVSKSKLLCVPSLSMLLPYLELSTNQDYLVQRITELAHGDCLSTFRWNSGGFWKGRNWDQDLPNDSEIVLHMLCVYLDSHLDVVSHDSPNRVFSSQYVLKVPETPSAKKSDLCLYQAVAHPPHFKVLVQESCIDLPQGRNNMFHAVITFLLYLKSQKRELLRQISKNLSELNILWIIEHD